MQGNLDYEAFLSLTIDDLLKVAGNENRQLPESFAQWKRAITVKVHLEYYEEFIHEVARGYALDISSYENDLSKRLTLEVIKSLIPAEHFERFCSTLLELDEEFKALTYSIDRYPPYDQKPYSDQFWWDRRPIKRGSGTW
jgi:hypothetical protein